MSIAVRRRWIVLGGLLSATLAAAAWVREGGAPERDAAVVAPAASERARQFAAAPAATESPRVNLDKLDARSLGQAGRDPFAAPVRPLSKPAPKAAVPAAVVAAPPPPPLPAAPPLPFSYMGKLVSGDDIAVFLVHGDRNLVVREGDTLDSRYRIERIADNAITLIYLPLDERQTLKIGEQN